MSEITYWCVQFLLTTAIGDETSLFFQIGDSNTVRLGDPIKLIGYSNYAEGDSWDLMHTSLRKKSRLFGHPLFEVACNIYHGASGGIALDKEDRIVGIICAGIESMEEEPTNSKQGFIPINTIIHDIEIQGY